MHRRSAFLRLTIGLGLAFFIATTAILVVVYFLVSEHLETRMRTLVAADLTGLADLYAQRRLPALREAIAARVERDEVSDAAYLLLDKAGAPLAGNLPAWPSDLAPDGAWTRFKATPKGSGTEEFTGAAATLPGGFQLAVGHSTAENVSILSRLLAILGAAAVLTLLIGGAGAALLSRWLVRRIVAVNKVAAEVRDGDLGARVPGADRPDEFGELAANFNAMLERIGRLVSGMREVSDRIAHELRTPLTRLRGQVTRLEAAPTGSPEASHALDSMKEEIGTTVAIFDALLDIATTEAEAGDTSNLKTVDLADTVANVIDLYDAVAEDRGIAIETGIAGPAVMLGDRGLLIRMLANVVDNAIKFSAEGGRVRIALTSEGPNHLLSVSDSGPGLSDDIRDRAFDRFARGAATATVPGHGLGLSVVRAIALRHGIKVSLEDAAPGLRVVFLAPALKA
jgi:signal transduction histidine kinase